MVNKEDALALAQEIATSRPSALFEVEGFTYDREAGYGLVLGRVNSDLAFELRSLDGRDGRIDAAEVTEEWQRRKQTGFRVPPVDRTEDRQ